MNLEPVDVWQFSRNGLSAPSIHELQDSLGDHLQMKLDLSVSNLRIGMLTIEARMNLYCIGCLCSTTCSDMRRASSTLNAYMQQTLGSVRPYSPLRAVHLTDALTSELWAQGTRNSSHFLDVLNTHIEESFHGDFGCL